MRIINWLHKWSDLINGFAQGHFLGNRPNLLKKNRGVQGFQWVRLKIIVWNRSILK